MQCQLLLLEIAEPVEYSNKFLTFYPLNVITLVIKLP